MRERQGRKLKAWGPNLCGAAAAAAALARFAPPAQAGEDGPPAAGTAPVACIARPAPSGARRGYVTRLPRGWGGLGLGRGGHSPCLAQPLSLSCHSFLPLQALVIVTVTPPHPRVSTPGSISVSEGWPLPMGPQVAVDLSRENPDWVHKCAGGPCPTNVLLCECVLRIMGYLHPWMWLSQHALTVPLLTLTPVHCPPYPCLHTLPSQTGMLTCV